MADKKGNRYSVYQGLDTDPSINWGTVASTISDQLTLLKEAKLQERDAIDKATQDQMDQLNKLPDVNDRSLSKIVLEASDRSKEYLRREMDLVKRGLRKPKDYSLFMQSQKNGYSDFGNVVKNWDKWNTAKQEAITNGTQSDLDMFTAEDIESFGNLKNKTVMTNPANGQIQVVSMGLDKDGNYTVMPNAGKNPEAFANPGSINARMSFDEKRKDTTALVTAETAEIARIVEAGRSENGVVTTMEDYRQSPSFDTWKTETTAKLTSNVYDTTQVLTQSGYVLGRTEAEARKKWESQYGTGEDAKPFDASKFIKVNMSGEKPVPQLSESQVNAAKDIVGNKIESQLDSIENKTQGFKDSADDNKRKDENTDDVGYIKELDIIMHGDPLEAEAALKRRIDTKNQDPNTPLDEKIVSFEITDDQIILRRAKGDPLTIDRVADTGVVDDPKTAEDESIRTLSNLDDVVAINDLISPKKLSRGRIENLIEKEGITLGKRRKGGVGSKVGKSEIPAISSGTLNPVSKTSIASDIQSKLSDTAAGNTNNEIKGTVQKAISTHMPQALQQELNDNPSLYGPTTIKKDDNLNLLTITIAGEETKIPTTRGTTSAEIADKITEAINKARKTVNENRTSSKVNNKNNKDKPSFIEWRETNPNGKVEDWKKATGR